jgi:hypothetical protein
VRAALPVDGSLAHQPEIGLVDERSRLKCVAPAVTTELAGGASPELVVHERKQLLLGIRTPGGPLLKQTCHEAG